MRDLIVASCALAFSLSLSAGCESEDELPPPISVGNGDAGPRDGGGGGGYIPFPSRDATTEDDDGGSFGDAGLNQDCDEVDFAPPGSDPPPVGMLFNAISMPSDFEVRRALVGWEASCTQPTIRIELSDGRCPDGRGPELSFLIPAEDINNGGLVLGQNQVEAETASDSLRVRYTRPDDLVPEGEWGTCTGASGTIDFFDQLETTDGSMLEARFLLELTRCDDGEESTQMVNGTFSVTLPAGLEDVCP